MLRYAKGPGLLVTVLGLCILLSAWDSFNPRIVSAEKDSDRVAGCGQVGFQFAEDGTIKDVKVQHSYPAGVYDDFMVDRMKKTNSSTRELVANIHDKNLSMTLYIGDPGKPTLSAKECRRQIGVKE